MNDNFLNDLNRELGTKIPPASDEVPPASDEVPPASDEVPPAQSGSSNPPAPQNQNEDPKNESNPMRTLRTQYNEQKKQIEVLKSQTDKQKALLERLALQRNLSVEELEAKLEEEENKRIAAEKGIPVETQKQLRDYEQRLKMLEQERIKDNFNMRVVQLRQKYALNDQQILDFAKQAAQAGLDVTQVGLDLNALYQAFNYNSLVEDIKKQARQEVLAEIQKSKASAPSLPGVQGKPNIPGVQPQLPKSDDDFFKNIFDQFKR